MKLFPLLFNLSFKVSLSLSLSLCLGTALSLNPSSPTWAQSDNGDLKSESESQHQSSDDSMNTLWAESQEPQKNTDSTKKSKSKAKAKSKLDAAAESKSDSTKGNQTTSGTPIDLSPSASKETNSDLSTPIMIQPAPAAMGETTVTDVSGLCSVSAFQNSDLLRTSAWPGVGPFTAESDNKYIDPQDNKLKLHIDGDHVTACELLLNNQNGSKQSILNLEMTCDFMLEALGAKGNKISEFNTYFEKNKDKIAASKANSENQVKTSSGTYTIALAGAGPASNSVLIQVISKNKVLTDEQSLASSISTAKTEPTDETPVVASVGSASSSTINSTTRSATAKAGITKTSSVKPTNVTATTTTATTKTSSKPAVKPIKPETTVATTEPVKTEAQQPATKDPLRDELAGAIRSWQTIKKSALKDRNPAGLSKILSGALLTRQTDSIKALTESKHYYELTPKGVVVEKYTELSSSPQKYSVYAKVMELTKIMKDGATKPEKETDDTYSVNYTVERSGDHWTISNSLLLVKKK